MQTGFTGAFFGVRLLWGPFMSIMYFQPKVLGMFAGDGVGVHSRTACLVFSLSNITLQLLNVYWTYLIIASLKRNTKRKGGPEDTKVA